MTRYNAYLPTFPFNLEKWQHWVCDSNSLLTFLHIFLLAYLLCGQKSTEKIVKVQLLYTAWKHNTIFLLKNAYLSSTKTMLLCWSHDSINNKLKKYLVMYVFFSWKPKITRDFYGVFHLVINGGYLYSYFFFIFFAYFGELILEWSMIFSPIYIMCTFSWIFDYFWLFYNTQVLSIGPHEVGPEYRLQAPPRYFLFIYFSLIMR